MSRPSSRGFKSHGRQHHSVGQGCRRHRHPDARRPERVGQRDERALPRIHAQGRRTPCRREGFDHRRRHHQRQEDVLRGRRPQHHHPGGRRERGRVLRRGRGDQARPTSPRDAGQACGRRDQRRRARWRPRDLPGVSSPHHRRRVGCGRRLPGGDARPAARRRRRHPQCADVRHPERVHERAVPGHPVQAGAGQGHRSGRRGAGRLGRGIGARRQGVDQGQPRRAYPAVGPEGLQDARRHPGQPRAGRHPAVVPGAAEEAAQGCADARAAGDPGRRGRGRAGGLRHRQPHREPLLHVSGHRSGRQEHDPGVLLRPAAHHRRRLAARRVSARRRSKRSVCWAPG